MIFLFCLFFCECSLISKDIQRDSYFDDLPEAKSGEQDSENCAACADVNKGIIDNSSETINKNSSLNSDNEISEQKEVKIQIPEGYAKNIFQTPEGKEVTIFYKKESKALGLPYKCGHLKNGKKLPRKGIGYIHVGSGSYGTDEMINYLIFAINKVRERYKNTADIIIGSLSKMGGGRFRPHKSHQNGLDVDIGYYQNGNVQLTGLKGIPLKEIDYEKTWYFIEQLFTTNNVEYIFMNYLLQNYFYLHAKSIGYSNDELDVIFQYPKGKRSKSGIIRHSRGHLAHFHVRFKRSSFDKVCQL